MTEKEFPVTYYQTLREISVRLKNLNKDKNGKKIEKIANFVKKKCLKIVKLNSNLLSNTRGSSSALEARDT